MSPKSMARSPSPDKQADVIADPVTDKQKKFQLPMDIPKEAVENLGAFFTAKEIKKMKELTGAISNEELIQKLANPRKKF